MLAPVFAVIFFTLMPSKPPLSLMIKLLLMLLLVTAGVVIVGEQLIDSPTGFGLFCWTVLYWSFYRSHKDPKDLLSTFMLLVVIIMSVVNLQFGVSTQGLPLLMLESYLYALGATYIGFLLFPGDEKEVLPDEKTSEGSEPNLGLILCKTTAMSITLAALIGTGSTQAILIGITISNMIRIPVSQDRRIFSQNRLVTTTIGILFTIPVMLATLSGMPGWVLLGVTLFLGLQLACYAIRRQCRMSVYQLLFTNYIILNNQVLTYQGADPFTAHLTRLIAISLAILIGVMILSLVRSKRAKLSIYNANSPISDM